MISRRLSAISDAALLGVHLERRIDPFFRQAFDRVLRDPLSELTTRLVNMQRKDDNHIADYESRTHQRDAAGKTKIGMRALAAAKRSLVL